MIQTRDVTKSFLLEGRTIDVLRGVSLSVAAGEFVSLMGPSGAGKSTLLHILGALDRPTAGDVLIQGKNPFDIPEKEIPAFRNRHIGFVFQFHYLLSEFTALENVMLPAMLGAHASTAGRERAQELLTKVGLKDRMGHKPGELSGGEQQRVAIARALMAGPDLILADEPSGNLDTHTGAEIFELLRQFNREAGTTFLIVTHNEAHAAQCDRIIRMIDGRVVAG